MLQENIYLSKHLSYLSMIDNQSVEQLINNVLDLDQNEQQLLDKMRKQSGSKNCGQQIIPNEYYIRCHDCGISQNHLFCQPCFDENLHQNHYLQLLRYDQGTGFCDCGDPNYIKAEGFCKAHSKKTISKKSSDKEIQLLGKLKILLEISCYNTIRLLEQSAKLPIIKADEDIILASQTLKQYYQFQQDAYKAFERMNSIIIYLTGSNPKLSEIVCQVFTSYVPVALQQIEQFQHNHQPIFDIGRLLENNTKQICECSFWKNLLRYVIFLNQEFEQGLNIEKYLPHLFIDHYVDVLTKTFVEMIPFQIQIFTKVKFHWEEIDKEFSLYVPLNYQDGLNNYLESQEVKDQNCTQESTKEVQFTSEIFGICYQLEKRIIQQFQFHKDQIEYVGWFIQQGVLSSKRFSKILHNLRVKLYRQLDKPQIIYCLDEFFLNNPQDSYAYRTIISFIPCQSYQKHQSIEIKYEDKDIFKLILNQCHIIRHFDQIFKDLIQNCNTKEQKLYLAKTILQGLLQKMIKTHPRNNQDQFDFDKLQFLFAQLVPADHIMIILLSFYCQLKQVQSGHQLIQIINDDLLISSQQLEQLFQNAVFRAIQNLVLINDTQYFVYYCRKKTIYTVNNDISEFSQESLDRSIVQMYFFLYGEEAIVSAYNYVEFINKVFKTNFYRDRFINTALSSDFDMYQTCSHYFMDKLPEDFKAAQRKVIKSLFYAQNYFSYNQILDNFNEMGNNQLNMLNQDNLLEILELEPYSGQLKLKKQFQPPLFEPLFFNNQAIFKQISDKLNENNNLEVNVFGNSIEYDFSCAEENLKTLSGIRKHVIDQLLNGQNKMVTLIMNQLFKSKTDENMKRKIIKSNKQLIYLFIIASKHIKLPDQNQQVLQGLFDIIQQLSVQNDIIDILKKKINGNEQIAEIKQPANNNQKLLLMKQKFQQKQQQFENNIGQDKSIIQQEYNPNLICNLCAQQMDVNLNDGYQLALLQLNNNIVYNSQYQDIQYLQYLENFSPSKSEITLSGCTHIFHMRCLKQLKVIEIDEESFYQCIVCRSLGNKIFPVSNLNSKAILQDIEYFTVISRTDMLEYYYKTYNVNGELDIKSVNAEIILQIYLHYIRQIIGNTNFYDSSENIQKFKQFTLLIKQQMDENISNQYFIIINKYPQSLIFQILQQILLHSLNIETYKFSQDILKILGNFEMLDLFNQDIFKKLFKYQPDIVKIQNLKSIIVEKVEQYTNIKDLQKRLIEKCIDCQKFTSYICIGCNQKICNNTKVMQDYRLSCCYRHSLKCHNGNVNILDAQTGVGFVAYQSQVILYQKSLFKTKLGQKFEGEFQKSIQYTADPLALQEFYDIQIHSKQITYIIKNQK